MRHLGRAALIFLVGAWAGFIALPFIGGLDPPTPLGAVLRNLASLSLAIAGAGGVLGAIALVRGPQRGSAAAAVALALLYLAVVTGAAFILVDHL